MTKWFRTALLLAVFLTLTVSCRQLYTTSFGEVFARDSMSIPKNTSLSDLIDLSNSSSGTDPDAAKEILDVLAGKKDADILALSIEDKTSILELATTAVMDMKTLMELADTTEGADTGSLIETALGAFDTSVNLDAVALLLDDSNTLDTAPLDTLLFAFAAVSADLAADIGSPSEVMDRLATGDITGLNDDQYEQMRVLIDAQGAINARVAAGEEASIGGFNLADLLGGNI